MKDDDVQSPLASLQEVAVFAWSLLELLFTRILPLVGFLVAHLVLQAGHLVSKILSPSPHSPSAYHRRHHRTLWVSEEQQRRPRLTYSAADPTSPSYTSATTAPWANSSLSGFKPSAAPQYATAADAEALQEAQPLAEMTAEPDLRRYVRPSVAPQDGTTVSGYRKKELTLPSAMQTTMAAQLSAPQTAIASLAVPIKGPAVPKTAEAVVPETLPTAAEESDRQHEQSSMPTSEAASVQIVQSTTTPDQKVIRDSPKNTDKATGQPSDPRGDEGCDVSDSTTLLKKDDSVAEQCNPLMEGGVGKSDKPKGKAGPVRPEQESLESIALLRNNTKRRQFTRRKSLSQSKRHPFAKVLPPSLSQIKRTIMQRSRRGSPLLKSPNPYS